MSTRNLHHLFEPESIAVLGASNKRRTVGNLLIHNLLEGEFKGPIFPINPHESSIAGIFCYPSLEDLPLTPDLAVVAIPPLSIPATIEKLGKKGVKAVIIITASDKTTPVERIAYESYVLEKAQSYLMRVVGPNCLGVMAPNAWMNASFAHLKARPGNLAFISQSGAMCTSVLDWSYDREVGFSYFVSLGDSLDVDLSDVVDYVANDPKTDAILLYIESVGDARKFMSAVRAASRNKPVVAMKAGRFQAGAQAAATHTGALSGSDDVFDEALKRAGALRVYHIEDLFAAVEVLGRTRPRWGENLAIMTNGGGLGVLAADELYEKLGQNPCVLSESTLKKLDQVLPASWSKGNPVDIIGDATGQRYAEALNILLNAPEIETLLVMHAPVGTVNAVEAAQEVIEVSQKHKERILTVWAGDHVASDARKLFTDRGIPTFTTPEQAISAFTYYRLYQKNQKILLETAFVKQIKSRVSKDKARGLIDAFLKEEPNGGVLDIVRSKEILKCYDFPVNDSYFIKTPKEARQKAQELKSPVALKIFSPQLLHKSDVEGVVLNLTSPDEVEAAAKKMLRTVRKKRPDATIEGFTLEKMVSLLGAYELILGLTSDPIFGPTLLFGAGGKAVEVLKDKAVALPPLNQTLARHMIESTRIYKLLKGFRDQKPMPLDALNQALLNLSQLVIDLAEVVDLDINPLLATESGLLALDARIKLDPRATQKKFHLAIRPYPEDQVSKVRFEDGSSLTLRPIEPSDTKALQDFLCQIRESEIDHRFIPPVHCLHPSQLNRLTQIDYDREMSFIAQEMEGKICGFARSLLSSRIAEAEFAVIISEEAKGKGIGKILVKALTSYHRDLGTKVLSGSVSAQNQAMLVLAKSLGFKILDNHLPGKKVIRLDLS